MADTGKLYDPLLYFIAAENDSSLYPTYPFLPHQEMTSSQLLKEIVRSSKKGQSFVLWMIYLEDLEYSCLNHGRLKIQHLLLSNDPPLSPAKMIKARGSPTLGKVSPKIIIMELGQRGES